RSSRPAGLLVRAALAVAAVTPLCAALGRRGCIGLYLVTTPILLGAAVAGYGLPSPAGVRADLDRLLGTRTEDILAGRCTHVAGDYWKVWPAVFHANLVLYERAESRTVWGVTV